MNRDAWGEVINGEETYNDIAYNMDGDTSCLIGWTDGRCTHHDILFTFFPPVTGRIQSLHPLAQQGRLLCVSLMRLGAFAFPLDGQELHPDYVAEKLNTGGDTAIALAQLINEVIKRL